MPIDRDARRPRGHARLRRAARHQRSDAGSARADRSRRRHRRHRAHPRRERHRQGAGRARHPRGVAAARPHLRQGQLRGAARPSCSSRSCSASSAAPSPAPSSTSPASSSSPTTGRCSSTRSARWARRCSPSCCRCCRTACSRGSADARTCSVDVRVVAATNRDLEMAVQDGQFREDLFFRLNVVCITLPPLRQRRDEIRPLTEHFLARYSEHYNKPPLAMATDTLRLFAEYDWPGNVRELENLVKRMVILGTDTAIRREVADAIAGRYLRVGPIPALQHADRLRRRAAPAAAPAAAAGPGRRPPPAAHRIAEGHRPAGGARSRARADLPHAAADPLEPPRGGGDPRHQLQGAALQDQGRGAGQSLVKPRNVLNTETFEFVLTNELKRALRSQNFVTLVLMEPRGAEPAAAVRRDRRPGQPRAARDRHARRPTRPRCRWSCSTPTSRTPTGSSSA